MRAASVTSIDRLRAWVAQGESETQEFKATTGQRRAAGETLCAFLNHRGGRVIFGVDARGQIRGQQMIDKSVEDVGQEIRLIEPPVFPTVERVPVDDDRDVLIITVDQGSRRPYTFRGIAYRRLGATTTRLSREEYNRLLLEQYHGVIRWENEPAAGWTVADLDTTEITVTLEEAIRRGRMEDPGTRDPAAILRGWVSCGTGRSCEPASSCSAGAIASCPTSPNACCGWRDSRGQTSRSFSTTASFTATPSTC